MRTFSRSLLLVTAGIVFDAAFGATAADRFECMVQPYLQVNLASAVSGVIDEVLVDRGDVVKKGEVLVRLKSDVERAHYDNVKAKADFAARRVKRNDELYRKQMISSNDKDELETNAQLLKLELVELEEQLKLKTIQSPLDGVVVERMYSPGEYVTDKPILKLAQIDPLRIEAALPMKYYGKIKLGQTGMVEWEAPASTVRSAKVKVVDRVIEAASGTMGVRLELPNPSNALPAGTKCWVRFGE